MVGDRCATSLTRQSTASCKQRTPSWGKHRWPSTSSTCTLPQPFTTLHIRLFTPTPRTTLLRGTTPSSARWDRLQLSCFKVILSESVWMLKQLSNAMNYTVQGKIWQNINQEFYRLLGIVASATIINWWCLCHMFVIYVSHCIHVYIIADYQQAFEQLAQDFIKRKLS